MSEKLTGWDRKQQLDAVKKCLDDSEELHFREQNYRGSLIRLRTAVWEIVSILEGDLDGQGSD